MTKLRSLDVSECSELEALPSMETLQSLGQFGAVVGKGMREAEEHMGVGAGDKASIVGC